MPKRLTCGRTRLQLPTDPAMIFVMKQQDKKKMNKWIIKQFFEIERGEKQKQNQAESGVCCCCSQVTLRVKKKKRQGHTLHRHNRCVIIFSFLFLSKAHASLGERGAGLDKKTSDKQQQQKIISLPSNSFSYFSNNYESSVKT